MGKNSLVGQRFGMLEVIEEESRNKAVYCLCKCDCGNTKWIRRDHLKKDIRSCGCQSTSNREKAKREDLTGQRFGRLTVIEKTDKKDYLGTAIYKCKCDCGNIKEVNARMLKIGNTRSCGCLRKKSQTQKKEKVKKEKRFRGKDLTGQRFGNLTVIRATNKRKWRAIVWECKCDCGNIIEVPTNYLKNYGYKKDCGCLKNTTKQEKSEKSKSFIKNNLVGQRFGNLTVIKATNKRKWRAIVWECRCDCGNIIEVPTNYLKKGAITSCGCFKKEKMCKDITGQKFEHLTAIKPTEKRKYGSVVWECKCDCGNIIEIPCSYLTNYRYKKHCGCLDKKSKE